MIILGLTGGIASGKSTVSDILFDMGIPIIDCDLIAREIVKPGSPALSKITNDFGREILNNDGSLNRKLLSQKVFGNPDLLLALNSLMHPPIKEIVIEKINEYRNMGLKCCVVDAPLLIESRFTDIVDYVLLVYVDEKTQINRLMKRDGISERQAIERIHSQMSFEEKKEYANFIIDNNHDEEYTKNQLIDLISEIMFLEDNDD